MPIKLLKHKDNGCAYIVGNNASNTHPVTTEPTRFIGIFELANGQEMGVCVTSSTVVVVDMTTGTQTRAVMEKEE